MLPHRRGVVLHNTARIALFHSRFVVGWGKHPCTCLKRPASPKGRHVAGTTDVPEDERLSFVVLKRAFLVLLCG